MSPGDYASIELLGTIASTAEDNGSGDLFVMLDVVRPAGTTRYKVVAEGNTLEGFSAGDRLAVTGTVTRLWPTFVAVRATLAMTPPS